MGGESPNQQFRATGYRGPETQPGVMMLSRDTEGEEVVIHVENFLFVALFWNMALPLVLLVKAVPRQYSEIERLTLKKSKSNEKLRQFVYGFFTKSLDNL